MQDHCQYGSNIVTLRRSTKETEVEVSLNIYGHGKCKIDTGIGFFDHMLDTFGRHSLMDLEVICKGDLHVDFHHSVEDSAIVIGRAINKAVFPVGNIERFGSSSIVMDEACAECDLDISNRAFLHFDMRSAENGFFGRVGNFDTDLVEEFFRALVFNANISAHLVLKRGKNLHHIIEASFKSFAVSLRRAVTKNHRVAMPSTKGCI